MFSVTPRTLSWVEWLKQGRGRQSRDRSGLESKQGPPFTQFEEKGNGGKGRARRPDAAASVSRSLTTLPNKRDSDKASVKQSKGREPRRRSLKKGLANENQGQVQGQLPFTKGPSSVHRIEVPNDTRLFSFEEAVSFLTKFYNPGLLHAGLSTTISSCYSA